MSSSTRRPSSSRRVVNATASRTTGVQRAGVKKLANSPEARAANLRADGGASVAFVSLGCAKNLVDSETMLGSLKAQGCRLVSSDAPADAVVINTCGFLEASKDESLDAIRQAVIRKNKGEVGRVVVAGCLVQRHRAKLLEWVPGIDAMVGVFDRDRISAAVLGPGHESARAMEGQQPKYWIAANALQAAKDRGKPTTGLTVHGKDGKGIGYYENDDQRVLLTPRHWAYLRVSEGCNQRCAFCTIPSIRGKMRSKPIDVVAAEARALLAGGAFELNLIGQDTTSYGMDVGYDGPNEGLIGLLTTLDGVAREFGSAWMRLMYAYPSNFTDAMIDTLASLPHVVKYIDIPLQHMSDRMLTAMRRHITGRKQQALLEKLRERIPGLAIRTTFITGFPGETEEDHRELLEFVESFGFDMMGVFKYSREEGTPAGTMDEDPALHVPDEVKAQREAELMLAQQRIAFENAAYVAEQESQFDVLIDAAAGTSNGSAVNLHVSGENGATVGREHAGSNGAASTKRTRKTVVGGHRYVGRCYHQAPQVDSVTMVESAQPLSIGELVRCRIVASEGYDLVARPVIDLEKRVGLKVVK